MRETSAEQRATFAAAWSRLRRELHAAGVDGPGFLSLLRPALVGALRRQPLDVARWWVREVAREVEPEDGAGVDAAGRR